MSAYSDKVLADGAMLYLRLNESSGTTVTSQIGGYTGTISGGVTLNQPGAVAGDTAMTFNGSTGGITGGSITIPAGAYALEWWGKTTLGSGQHCAWTNYDATGALGSLETGVNTGKAFIYKHNDIFATSNVVITDGNWHHVVVTFDGTNITLFVDGVLDKTVASTAKPATTTTFYVGNRIATEFWSGDLDDVAIYPTALTAQQIATHYALRLAYAPYATRVLSDGASLYLRLDETSGTTAYSQVGGYTGTISGGVTLNQPGALAGNTAMSFDGTGKIVIPNGVYDDFASGSFSIEVWWKATNTDATQRVIVSDFSALGPGIQLLNQGGWPTFYAADGTNSHSWYPPVNPMLNDGHWHHVVCCVARGTPHQQQIYIDGQLLTSTTITTLGAISSAQNFSIAQALAGTNGFIGALDDVAVYPVALTAQQIATHYALAQAVFQAASTYAWATLPPSIQLKADFQGVSGYTWATVPAVLMTPSWPSSVDIDRALVGRLLADPRLAGLMPDGVFWDEAKQDATQFIIVSLVDETDEPMFEKRATENAVYLVKAVALNTSGADVVAAAARIDALLDYKTFAINGYTLMISRRIARIRSTEVDDLDPSIRWQHHGGRYEVSAASTI